MRLLGKLSATALLLQGISSPVRATTVEESFRFVSSSESYVELVPGPNLLIDLKYASTDNFMGQNLYGVFNKPFLHHIAAGKLTQAADNLADLHPGHKLVVYDALRPRSVQYLLWNKVVGTDKQPYVANPKTGSIHNYGFAVDLSILDATGHPLDMGTAFDDFSSLAQPQLEEKFLKEGRLNAQQVANRRLLRSVLEPAGFLQLKLEWWHFDALPKAEVKSKYKMVE